MSSDAAISEFQTVWLPNVTGDGLQRLTELLQSSSPYLIHGAFTRAIPMGCLASHIAWNHPDTGYLNEEAGACWLTKIAGLNPATSAVILAWDRNGIHDRTLRAEILAACLAERDRRSEWVDEHVEELFASVATGF